MTDSEHYSSLQIFIYPRKLANKNGQLRYNWKVEDFTRLDGLLYSNQGDIKVHLKGVLDNRLRCLLEVHLVANIQLECQTSFEPIDYRIDHRVVYCTVDREEQIANLEAEYEALLLQDGQVDIKQVIEDELILTLPLVANKTSNEAAIKMSYGKSPPEAEVKKNPFLTLATLKKNNNM